MYTMPYTHAVVTVLTLESPNVYVISNVVLPENMLMATTILPNPSTPDTVYKANIDYLPVSLHVGQ